MLERERTREPRTREPDLHDAMIASIRAVRERGLHGQIVVRGREVSWSQNRQACVKRYLRSSRHSSVPVQTALDDWAVFVNRITTHSGKHRHQGGLVIYVLEGEGYSVVEGERLAWEAGDLMLLPFRPGGVEHQHFNRDDDKPARWIAFVNAYLFEWSATEMVQLEEHPDYGNGRQQPASPPAATRAASRPPEPTVPPASAEPARGREQRALDASLGLPAARSTDLLEWLFDLRDRQRELRAKATWLVKGNSLAWEHNRQGKMKWYLHPALDDTVIRTLIVWVQEIPAGGRTGIQRTPGGTVLYVLRGRGYTLLDGVRHDWEAEDCLNLPIRTEGVAVQHVNLDPHEPAQFIGVDLNLVDTLGVDRGVVFEQVEAAPNYPGA